ncbi:hypothetical protein [Jatrophihabitans sp.]|jgi:hypothetical protein|uniref:sulfotransferase-like domain-containing protein n=1 Tax=Jatrophihabitans sp. TaxID=1932789 RepID=UPI002F04506D
MRLSLWSHPRSRSTALERYFQNRGDVLTHHEVLADYYYIHLRAEPIDHAELDGDSGRSYEEAAAVLLEPTEKPLVHKDFPYHAIDELCADPRWLAGHHVILVREPRETIYSNLKLRGQVTAKNLGYADLWRWYCHLDAAGSALLVLDSGRLNVDPVEAIGELCQFAGLAFDERHLSWPADMNADWAKWAGWHVDVARSRGFGRAASVPADWTVPAELEDVLAEASEIYTLLQQRIPTKAVSR